MSIAQAERLKKEWTDKYVVVDEKAPELKRFVGLTGTVRTINMNCRALVEFDGAVDIGWYDIDPAYLKVVTEPVKKKPAAEHAKPAAAAAAKPAAAPKPAGEKKLSPLELARQQGAAAKAGAEAAKKPSPLELARKQGAAKAEAAAETAVAEEAPKAAAPAAKPAAGGAREKPGSTAEIIELCRKQGPAKR